MKKKQRTAGGAGKRAVKQNAPVRNAAESRFESKAAAGFKGG